MPTSDRSAATTASTSGSTGRSSRRSSGPKATDPDWQSGLAAMVDYARKSGFLSEDGTAIRAHVEWDG